MASGFAIVLPARYQSTRFPGKPLAVISGKPLIQWVYERARGVAGSGRVVVATDHDGIAAAVRDFGGEAVITTGDHRTGTDRVAEVARKLDADIIVNLQGDEPVFPAGLVEQMVAAVESDASIDIATACHAIVDENEFNNPNIVKVVVGAKGRALYFSRSPIPHRLGEKNGMKPEAIGYRHVGIYVFRRESLIRFSELPPTPLELSESLEQLRALENDMVIRVVRTTQFTVGVDVPGDVKNVEKALGTP
jgi:3-deoxy-manno-octulosonate cytidylyltransferase (CMP-KDO synthetase)